MAETLSIVMALPYLVGVNGGVVESTLAPSKQI